MATSVWLHNFPELSFFCHSFHVIPCCVRPTFDGATCKLLMDPCQHVTKKFFIIDQPTKCAEWQVMQQSSRCLWNVLESVRWSLHRGPQFLPQIRCGNLVFFPIIQMVSRQNADRRPTQRKGQRSSLRSAQRRRATEPHRLPSRSITLNHLVTWDEKQMAYRRRTQC